MVKILESATLILEEQFENFRGSFLKILSGKIGYTLSLILEILLQMPSFLPRSLRIFEGTPQTKIFEDSRKPSKNQVKEL